MIRLFYLTDSLEAAAQASQKLHEAGVTDWNFHVLSSDEYGLYRQQLHGAAPWQKRDILRSGERGAMLGLSVGVALALLLMFTSSSEFLQHPLVAVSIAGVCTLFGAWVGGLFGISAENHQVARFHDDIAAGKYLLLVDVRKSRLSVIKGLMASIPGAPLVGADQTVILPFARA